MSKGCSTIVAKKAGKLDLTKGGGKVPHKERIEKKMGVSGAKNSAPAKNYTRKK